ncbi:MAG: O-antigen ligase family protein [Phycisphaerales bacterium]|nr:MAG: O-antigen ligase family protein [Phycisphaerales bacterium]
MTMRTHHVVLVFLLTLVLAGSSFLTSSGRGQEEGAVPWSADSLLQPLAEALNLRYAFPTPLGVEIKSWVFGAGTAAVMIVAVIGWYLTCARVDRQQSLAALSAEEGVSAARTVPANASNGGRILAANMSALAGAQMMLGILVIYSFISANWSVAWDISLGGSVVLACQFAWAVALGRGLNPRAARVGARILVVVTVLTAALAIWYFYERNPNFRAKYPLGNPLFLAAVLLPAILLSICGIGGYLHEVLRRRARPQAWILVFGGLIALGVLVWCLALTGARPPADAGVAATIKAFAMAGSRAALLGLIFGILAIPFWLSSKRGRVILTVAAVLAVVLVVIVMVPQWQSVSEFGRGATVRLRLYAWSYALKMVQQRSLTGVGQGGYSLIADGPEFAGRDAVTDPLSMQGRLAHAHNEWIETWADLGTIGLAFLVAGYLLTFLAGAGAIRRMPRPADRWVLAGLMAALIAMGVEEFASVALRVPGLPAVYFTVLGLIWAMSREDEADEVAGLRRPAPSLRKLIVLGVAVLALCNAALYYRDWTGVRAQYDASRAFNQSRYGGAIQAAEFAAAARLEPHRKLESRVRLAGIYSAVAEACIQRAHQRAARVRAGEIEMETAQPLIDEDLALAEEPLEKGLELTQRLRDGFAIGYADLGMIEADLCRLLLEHAVLQGKSRPALADELRVRATRALQVELLRHRFSEPLVLRYLGLAVGIPVAEQIEMLCGPLRGGTASPSLYVAAEQLSLQQPFAQALGFLLAQAEEDLRSGDPLRWKYVFSPEACRIAAALEGRGERFASAVVLLDRAVRLYSQGRNAELLSLCRSQTLLEQAWFTFLNDPLHPEEAIRLSQEAVYTVPPIGRGEVFRNPMYAQLITLAVAVGDHDMARAWAERLYPDLDAESFKVMIGTDAAVVADLLMRKDLPQAFDFVEQSRRLAPEAPRAMWTDARWAFRHEDYDRVIAVLSRLLELDDPRRVALFLQAAVNDRPDAAPLREYHEQLVAAGRIPAPPTATAPVAEPDLPAPATMPSVSPWPGSPSERTSAGVEAEADQPAAPIGAESQPHANQGRPPSPQLE